MSRSVPPEAAVESHSETEAEPEKAEAVTATAVAEMAAQEEAMMATSRQAGAVTAMAVVAKVG